MPTEEQMQYVKTACQHSDIDSAAEDTIWKLIADWHELQEQKVKWLNNSAAEEHEIYELQAKVAEWRKQCDWTQSECDAVVKDAEELKVQVASLTAENEQFKAQVAEFTDEVGRLQKRIEEMQVTDEEFAEMEWDCLQRLGREAQIKTLTTENEQLKARITTLDADCRVYREREERTQTGAMGVADLQDKIAVLTAHVAKLGLQLDTMGRDSAQLEQERDEARKALIRLWYSFPVGLFDTIEKDSFVIIQSAVTTALSELKE